MAAKTPREIFLVCATLHFACDVQFLKITKGMYAGEVGVLRLLRLFERYGIKTTWFIPGKALTFETVSTGPRDVFFF